MKKSLLYFYLHNENSGLSYDPFEYRFMKLLSKKYALGVVFFKRRSEIAEGIKNIPRSATLVALNDFPFPRSIPKPFRWPLETLTRTLIVAIFVRRIRASLVFANWLTRSNGFYCAVARVRPLLVAVWGSDVLIEAQKSRVLRMFGKLTVRLANAIIVDSEVQRRAVVDLGCPETKICCFPWGIDLERFKPQTRYAPRRSQGRGKIVICTRKHFPIYGVEYLLRAIPRVLLEVKNAKFLLTGNGPLLDYHKHLAKQLSLEKYVKFLGFVPNDSLPDLLNTANVYVSPSLSDGSSASLMEALGCGLPVVVTKISANQEWIKDGENGFLVPPCDSEALARSITQLLRDPELCTKMKNANLELARKRANWAVNSRVLEECIERAVRE
jgi:glycosyltransferase involved in cell wall biosynthesis